ncbi:MAG TPA: 4a-hydroxytetrahydrobiopterin dehydratase [Mariprofundaceae bacterium]|nr:4a-hydroxytetrahydrobiopterin dehydratase [Mariprofundaceae bacterium]
MRLVEKKCVPCQGGIPPMLGSEASRMLAEVPGWELIAGDTKIQRTFRFKNFTLAQIFATHIGELAEAEQHHPDICFGWGYCTVVFYTHKIGGLHENDFIMAAKVNAIPA